MHDAAGIECDGWIAVYPFQIGKVVDTRAVGKGHSVPGMGDENVPVVIAEVAPGDVDPWSSKSQSRGPLIVQGLCGNNRATGVYSHIRTEVGSSPSAAGEVNMLKVQAV